MNAAPERSALMQQEATERAKRLRRAVEDVMTGGLSMGEAARNRRVSEPRFRIALAAAGWVPKRVRQRRSRAKQLPQPRSDNQP